MAVLGGLPWKEGSGVGKRQDSLQKETAATIKSTWNPAQVLDRELKAQPPPAGRLEYSVSIQWL